MSKLVSFLFLILLIGLIGGFVYLSFVDVPVEQTTVTHEITLHDFKSGAAE